MQGYLEKQTSGAIFRKFQQRYFAIEGLALVYYAKRDDYDCTGDSKGRIDLTSCTAVGPTDGDASEREFWLESPERLYWFRAPSQRERNAWIANLQVWPLVSADAAISSDSIGIPRHISAALLHAIQYCDAHGNDVEGLFRVPGTKSAIDRICEQIYMLDGVSSLDAPDATVFDVACVIKHLLRKLPETILSEKLVKQFESATAPEAFRDLIALLPPVNRDILMALSILAVHQIENANVTKSTAKSLSICMSPAFSSRNTLQIGNFLNLFSAIADTGSVLFGPSFRARVTAAAKQKEWTIDKMQPADPPPAPVAITAIEPIDDIEVESHRSALDPGPTDEPSSAFSDDDHTREDAVPPAFQIRTDLPPQVSSASPVLAASPARDQDHLDFGFSDGTPSQASRSNDSSRSPSPPPPPPPASVPTTSMPTAVSVFERPASPEQPSPAPSEMVLFSSNDVSLAEPLGEREHPLGEGPSTSHIPVPIRFNQASMECSSPRNAAFEEIPMSPVPSPQAKADDPGDSEPKPKPATHSPASARLKQASSSFGSSLEFSSSAPSVKAPMLTATEKPSSSPPTATVVDGPGTTQAMETREMTDREDRTEAGPAASYVEIHLHYQEQIDLLQKRIQSLEQDCLSLTKTVQEQPRVTQAVQTHDDGSEHSTQGNPQLDAALAQVQDWMVRFAHNQSKMATMEDTIAKQDAEISSLTEALNASRKREAALARERKATAADLEVALNKVAQQRQQMQDMSLKIATLTTTMDNQQMQQAAVIASLEQQLAAQQRAYDVYQRNRQSVQDGTQLLTEDDQMQTLLQQRLEIIKQRVEGRMTSSRTNLASIESRAAMGLQESRQRIQRLQVELRSLDRK